MKDLGWEPVSAHNGFLEIALQFGLVGLAVFMAFLVEALRRTLRLFNSSDERLDAWPLLAVISLIVMNVADPTFAVYNELRWVVFVTAFLYATLGYHRKSTRDEFDHSEHLGFQAGWNGTPSNGTLR
jgi:O-antigen ligase